MRAILESLARDIATRVDAGLHATSIPRLALFAAREPSPVVLTSYEPTVCFVLQGSKRVVIGNAELYYDPSCSLIAALELPASCQIVDASPARPFVAVRLEINRDALVEVAAQTAILPSDIPTGFALTPFSADLADSLKQLLALLDRPEDISVLGPLREKEILYRLIQSPQGGIFRQIVRDDSRLSRIRLTTEWIRAHINEPVRIKMLADLAGMSLPSFHRHFKTVTAMSPLQYQKTLRLQAARQLIVLGSDVRQAAFSVGYQSASQFTRDYSRVFGIAPSRHDGSVSGLFL